MNKFFMVWNEFFQVNYEINPWMMDKENTVDVSLAKKQWTGLKEILEAVGAEVVAGYIEDKEVPDIVFTANAGITNARNAFIPSNFKYDERKREKSLYIDIFRHHFEYNINELPSEISFEGEGDALFDYERGILWLGSGFRTSPEALSVLKDFVRPYSVIPLKLVDKSFYHLDTCFCPLSNGCIGYIHAFDNESCEDIVHIYGEKQIWVSKDDAYNFACNAVEVDDNIIMNKASNDLIEKLNVLGYITYETALTEFIKSGGSAKCLTLRLRK